MGSPNKGPPRVEEANRSCNHNRVSRTRADDSTLISHCGIDGLFPTSHERNCLYSSTLNKMGDPPCFVFLEFGFGSRSGSENLTIRTHSLAGPGWGCGSWFADHTNKRRVY